MNKEVQKKDFSINFLPGSTRQLSMMSKALDWASCLMSKPWWRAHHGNIIGLESEPGARQVLLYHQLTFKTMEPRPKFYW